MKIIKGREKNISGIIRIVCAATKKKPGGKEKLAAWLLAVYPFRCRTALQWRAYAVAPLRGGALEDVFLLCKRGRFGGADNGLAVGL